MKNSGIEKADTEKRLKSLIKASQSLAVEESFDRLISGLLTLAMEVTGAQASSFMLYKPQKNILEFIAAKNEVIGDKTDELLIDSVEIKMGQGIAGTVAQRREPVIIEDAQKDDSLFRQIDRRTGFVTRGLLAVPVLYGDQLLGVIEVLNAKHKPTFDVSDRELLESFAHLAAVAIIRSRLLYARLRQEKLNTQMEAAANIQSLFWPKTVKVGGTSHIWGTSVPASFVGGDVYDWIPMPDGSWLVYVADVSDKGLPAAMVMAALWSCIRSEVFFHQSVGGLIKAVNHTMYHLISEEGFFATILIGKYWPRSGRLEFVNGGHLPLVWCTPGHLEFISKPGGLPLGIEPHSTYKEWVTGLAPGDSVLIISDGITEAENDQKKLFGFSGIEKLFRSTRKPPLGQTLVEAVDHWQGGTEPSDDLTVLEIWQN